MRNKLYPSISYLQKLGPEYIQQVFDSARWIFEQNSEMAFEVCPITCSFCVISIVSKIFTSEDVELPRQAVVDYLESIDQRICAHYLEFLIDERKEDSPAFHDRLAELYLSMILLAKKRGEDGNMLFFSHLLIDQMFYPSIAAKDLFQARPLP